MKSKTIRGLRRIGLLFVAYLALESGGFVAAVVRAQSQEQIAETMTSDLETAAGKCIAEKRITDALPFLEELARRFSTAKGQLYEEKLEKVYFYLGVGYLQLASYDEAITYFDKYLAIFSRAERAPTVSEFLADAYRLTEAFAKAADRYKRLRGQYTLKKPHEMEVLAKETECLTRQHLWDQAVPVLRRIMAESTDAEMRGDAATSLVRAHIELDQIDDVVGLLPKLLSVSRARYSVPFNILLLQAGDARFYGENYADALMFYQLVLTREELQTWHEQQIAGAERAMDDATRAGEIAQSLRYRERLAAMKEGLKELAEQDSYTEELVLRRAQTYFEMGRRWEAFWTYRMLWQDYPDSDHARRSLYSAFAIAGELHMDERAVALGHSFMDDYGQGEFFDELSLQLAQLHVRRKEYAETIGVAIRAREIEPKHTFADRLMFLMGYSHFQLEQFDDTIRTLEQLGREFPDSETREGADYWIAMARLFKQDYSDARDLFSEFVQKYIGGIYYEDASFRLAVSEYGLLNFPEARKRFDDFLMKFPASALAAEACAFLGDLDAAEGHLESALAHYLQVEQRTRNMAQINYAANQIGRIHELLEDYPAMEKYFQDYLRAYRLEGNYTEAIRRIGLARKMQGDLAGMLDMYFSAIRRYGNDPSAMGLDLILQDWLQNYEAANGRWPEAELDRELARAYEEKRESLVLRLEWATSRGQKPAAAETLFTTNGVAKASPGVLLWMGEQSQPEKPEVARAALQRLADEFSDSPWGDRGLLALAELEGRAGNLTNAIGLLRRARDLAPSSELAGLALKREADLLRRDGRLAEARETYLKVLEVKEWRGPLWPESLYGAGESLMEEGELREAFAYFQRVYVLYGGYPEWTARAYLRSAECLERLNRRAEARQTYQEFVGRQELSATSEYREAQARLEKLL